MKTDSNPKRPLNHVVSRTFLAAVLAGSCLLTTACDRAKSDGKVAGPALPPPQVGVVTIKAEPLAITTELPGRVSAVRVAEVRARATGILQERLFKEGAEVKANDVLFQIDEAPLRASLDSAKASLAKAEANLKQAQAKANRYKTLIAVNAVSRQDYDEAIAAAGTGDADILAAKAALQTAELNLGYAKVTSPISGRIGKAKVTEGALVTAGEATQLATVQQLDPIYCDFTQSSTELLRLKRQMKEGQLKSVASGEAKVTLLLEDGTPYTVEGKLLFSDITVDQTTGMVTLRAEFPNPDGTLLPGMFARVRIDQAVDKSAITVPQRGVTRNPDGTGTVFVVGPGNIVEPRIVKTDRAVGDKWVVIDGLHSGESVVVEGLQKIRPGATVSPVAFGGASEAKIVASLSK